MTAMERAVESLEFEFRFTGNVYGSPTTYGVAPLGYSDSFQAAGTVREIFRQYAAWRRSGDRYYPLTGQTYPERYIHGMCLVARIAERVAEFLGVPYGCIAGEVAQIAREEGVII